MNEEQTWHNPDVKFKLQEVYLLVAFQISVQFWYPQLGCSQAALSLHAFEVSLRPGQSLDTKCETASLAAFYPGTLTLLNSVLCFLAQKDYRFSTSVSVALPPQVQPALRLIEIKMGESPRPFILSFQVSAPLQNLPAFIHSAVPSDCSFVLLCRVWSCFLAGGSDPVMLSQPLHGSIFGNHQTEEKGENWQRLQVQATTGQLVSD